MTSHPACVSCFHRPLCQTLPGGVRPAVRMLIPAGPCAPKHRDRKVSCRPSRRVTRQRGMFCRAGHSCWTDSQGQAAGRWPLRHLWMLASTFHALGAIGVGCGRLGCHPLARGCLWDQAGSGLQSGGWSLWLQRALASTQELFITCLQWGGASNCFSREARNADFLNNQKLLGLKCWQLIQMKTLSGQKNHTVGLGLLSAASALVQVRRGWWPVCQELVHRTS